MKTIIKMLIKNLRDKFNCLFSKKQKIGFVFFFLLSLVGMLLELLGIGLVLPFLEILTRGEDNLGYSQYFEMINIEIISKEQLIFYSILFLLSIFTVNLFDSVLFCPGGKHAHIMIKNPGNTTF